MITIARLTQDDDSPQRGVLLLDGEPVLLTLELPWKNNEKNISCIPIGSYVCSRTFNRKLKKGQVIPTTFEINSVPGRSGILFHSGNVQSNSNGCILIGSKYGFLNDEVAILDSRAGFKKFLELTENANKFALEIKKL